jgi:hypothetical protein
MEKLWSFLRRKRNREILGWLGGGLVVAAAGLWAIVVFLFPPSGKSGVSAECGSNAIGGNVSGSTVTAGGPSAADCSRKSK